MKPYRTIFTGILVQDSAMSVGGNEPHRAVDSPLCRDGLGRFTIRGTTLAGALVSTASKIFGDLDAEITGKFRDKKMPPPRMESVWRVFNSHPQGHAPGPELRQNVRICEQTGAAADNALFDTEGLPRGTVWTFCMEVNTSGSRGARWEAIAAEALREWERGRCWIGRDVARGLGWITLEDLRAYRLNVESHADKWPDSRIAPEAALEKLGVHPVPSGQFDITFRQSLADLQRDKSWCYIDVRGQIIVGEHTDGYGLDSLSIGGHAGNSYGLSWSAGHYPEPDRRKPDAIRDTFNPDCAIVFTRKKTAAGSEDQSGDPEPFIPGSSIRGTLRHALARLVRLDKRTDPDAAKAGAGRQEEQLKSLETLFGSIANGSALLVRDAYLAPGGWQAVWLQHHAEDEFTQGVYGTSKFDRLALVSAVFQWRMVIEASTEPEARQLYEALKQVLTLGGRQFVPIGGGQWRGHGWVRWKVDSSSLGKAGNTEEVPL